MEENNLLEDQLFMYPTLRSLKEMASYNVALSVWHHYYYSSPRCNENLRKTSSDNLIFHFGINDTYKEDCDEMVKSLKLPRSIEDEIKCARWYVYDEIRMWIRQLECCVTPIDLSKYPINRLVLIKIVWLSSKFVHHEMSARKILSTIEVSPAEKFSIMSEFCLEDEILNFDINSLPEDFMQRVTTVEGFSEYHLPNYWVRYLKKESHLHNLRSPAIVKEYYGENWTAFKYFWHLLDSNDRESLVEILLSSDYGDNWYDNTYLYQYYNKERLFFMLSSQQQHSLLSRLCHRIILYFSRPQNGTHKQSALWAWRQSKEFISFEQFSHMMRFLSIDRSTFVSVYIKIWKTAPDSFRQSLLNSDRDERDIISKCLENYHLHSSGCGLSPSVCEFFIEFLSLKSASSRKRIITERAIEFGCDIKDLDSLQELLDLCLPDSNDQLEFKRKVIDSRKFQHTVCTKLSEKMNFSELNTRLEFYLPDRSAVQEFIRQLLDKPMDRLMIRFTYKLVDWDKLNNFIDETFHGNASVSLDIKRRFISSVVSRYYGSSIVHSGYYGVDEMIQIVESIFDNGNLEDIKRVFLDSIQRKFAAQSFWHSEMFSFDVDCVFGIVSWCLRCSDEQTIREFKNNFLPVDIFFDGIFIILKKKCAHRDENFLLITKLLFKLNRCLRWYMPSIQERNKYKRSRINETKNFEIFDVLKSKKGSDLEIVLEWLFDNDEEAIAEFKLSKLKLE